MANFDIYGPADARTFNFYDFVDDRPVFSNETETSWTATYKGNLEIDVTGFGFHYDPSTGFPVTGTTTAATLSVSGVTAATISGIAITSDQARLYIAWNDAQMVNQDIFKGNDKITSSGFNDYLDGYGGADTLVGGAGDDTYVVDNLGDRVVEGNDAGDDTVRSSISYKLRGSVEKLVLTGSDDISGVGTDGVNEITGNTGKNVLNGGGGADTMTGGDGDDTYYVDNADDHVVELAGGGSGDSVRSQASYTLADNVEVLRLANDKANISGTGNASDNTISGSASSNVITGLGGRDVLTGGDGRDVFTYKALSDSTMASEGRDTITDFKQSQIDRIDLRLIDANGNSADGDQGFTFIGSAAFSNKAGQLHYEASGTGTLVSGDVNGDGTADFSILLNGAIALNKGDFYL